MRPPTPRSPVPHEVGEASFIGINPTISASCSMELASLKSSIAPEVAWSAPIVKHSEHLLQPNGSILGASVAKSILPRFPDLLSAIPVIHNPALRCIDFARQALTHAEIRVFLQHTGCVLHEQWKLGRGHRVALVLPNGPELALAILSVSCYCCVVPLNAFGAVNELQADLQRAAVDAVIALSSDNEHANPQVERIILEQGLPYIALQPDMSRAGLFCLARPSEPRTYQPPRHGQALFVSSVGDEADRSAGDTTPRTPHGHKSGFNSDLQHHINQHHQYGAFVNTSTNTDIDDDHPHPHWAIPNQHQDEVLVLFTSGTTGQKKLVPHLLQDVLVATACIAVSWKLTPYDTNCNLMPLFHVGGIIRQVYSPILSGGCVICCPAFDPATFWSLMGQFTWYYAAPTMHQLILQTGKNEGHIREDGSCATMQLRMIANAAGGLLPSMARELRQTFNAYVLPSYGMTECMPITSPPATYLLEKPGTSGVAVGPEIAILNVATSRPLQAGKEGPICVRGEPCFRGYGKLADTKDEASESKTTSCFLKGGWFDTGDLGYMDTDGYLYITGRSKEVINRGGEIISPMEVEEACVSHPAITACVAFSTKHSILQEVVGLLMVPARNTPRIDLPTLHEYLGQGRLAAPKWPQCLVYMDAVPKSFTNKLLRVKLGKRLGLPELNDNMYWIERTFQAHCPPVGAPVEDAIPCERVSVSAAHVQQVLCANLALPPVQHDLLVVPHPCKLGSLVCYVSGRVDRLQVVHTAREKLHAYAVPSHVCACLTGQPLDVWDQDLLNQQPLQPEDAIGSILQENANRGLGPSDPLIMGLQELFQNLLDLDCLPNQDTNFFNLGGSSMLASQLASKIRKLHNVPFGGAEVFHASSCSAIASVIRERRGDGNGSENASASKLSVDPASMAASSLFSQKLDLSKTPFDPQRMDIPFGFAGLLFQLLPLLVIYPIWHLTRTFLFFRALLWVLHNVPVEGNLYKFVGTLVVFHTTWVTVTPLIFVLCKWLIIGEYRTGRFPIWGEYYLRWWFCDVLRKLIGRGSWGAHPETLNIYYRLLGAKIGKGARISVKADIAEFDLVSIGECAYVEFATVRGFGVDNGCMIMGPVGVGKNSSVGARSVVAPYTTIPDGEHLGPATSSYEISSAVDPSKSKAAEHITYNRQAYPKPSMLSQLLVISPITFFVDALSHMPALFVLVWMVSLPLNYGRSFHSMGDLIAWLANPRRIPFFIGVRIARSIFAPLFYIFGATLVKWFIIGKFESGPRALSEWQLIRHDLAETLFSRENMQEVCDIIGRHYEGVSMLYRLLGAKVGKRVFWPGRQPVFTGEFDLLEIGDDVVFGSRSSLICTTINSCEKIVLCAGANVSDNTVVLPGSIIGKNAVLGSNSVCPRGRYLPEASVWFGSRGGEPVMLEKGVEEDVSSQSMQSDNVDPLKLQMEGDSSTLRPFGRAFYNGEANYFVFPLCLINLFTILVRIAVAALNGLPIIGAMHLAAGYFYGWPVASRNYNLYQVTTHEFFTVVVLIYIFMHFIHVNIWLLMEVLSKWMFIGRRSEGRFNYDTSNYGQNWECYQICGKIRDLGRMSFLDFITGTPMMASFFRLLGCKIGNDCCLYPTGADPFMPEPDLVEMGDRVVIDCASVVCHLNTRGNFELVKIVLENNVTLRARARIQQGVQMETGSMILEKSLAMTGEVIEADSVWFGAPAARLFSYDTSSIGTRTTQSYAGSNNDVGAFV